jgi:hypothetical protein
LQLRSTFELVTTEAVRPTEHPDALDYILRGQAGFLKPPSRGRYAEQVSFFERASALDPRSVEAQSELANVLVARVLNGVTNSAAADIARAEGLVGQALTTSPRSPHAHFAKAQVLRARNRFEEAIPEYETALAVDRNWVFALFALSQCELYAGSIEEAVPLLEKAIRLSPRDPNIGYWDFLIGRAHLLQSHTDEGIHWLEKARSLSPEAAYPHAWLASAYALKGESERAASELAEARRLGGKASYSSIAHLTAAGYAGSLDYWGYRRSSPCSKPRISPVCARSGCQRNDRRPLRGHPSCHGSTSGTPVDATSRVLRVTNVRPRVIAIAAINVSITGRLRPADSSPRSRAAAASTGRTRSAKVDSMPSTHAPRRAAIAESVRRLASTPLRNSPSVRTLRYNHPCPLLRGRP